MSAPLLSAAEAGATVEALIAERAGRGPGVHRAVLLLLALGLAALPLVRVPVTARHPGIVRPEAEPHLLRAAREGVVEALHLRPGEPVRAGQLVLTVRPHGLEEHRSRLRQEREQAERDEADLLLLTASSDPLAAAAASLRSARYRQELLGLREAVREHQLRADWVEAELDRARVLASGQLVARVEVERLGNELDRLRGGGELLVQRARADWLRSLDEVRAELLRIRLEEEEMREEAELAEVRSPLAGSLERLGAVAAGSYVRPGEELALIAPSAELVAEVYVPPRSVGRLRTGARVRLQVDAFRSHGWGSAGGRVGEIPAEARLLEGRPVFPVLVVLDRDHLTLPGGTRGYLRAGMTLEAHFLLAERTLWQLMRDGITQRLDPPRSAAEP